MTIDKYTKAVLTIIAVALLGLLFKDVPVVSTAQAAFDRGEEVIKVQIVSIDESPSLRWEAIKVETQ